MAARGKSPAPPDSDAFITEVHKAEEEIEGFLAQTRRKADAILSEAQEESETRKSQARREAAEASGALKESLLRKAREDGDGMRAQGTERAEREKTLSRERMKEAVARILTLVLGGGK